MASEHLRFSTERKKMLVTRYKLTRVKLLYLQGRGASNGVGAKNCARRNSGVPASHFCVYQPDFQKIFWRILPVLYKRVVYFSLNLVG